MAKLKKSEALTVEREREIQQVGKSILLTFVDVVPCSSPAYKLYILNIFLLLIGCRICKWACSNYEGFIGPSHRPG